MKTTHSEAYPLFPSSNFQKSTASVGFYFIDGNSDTLKLIANAEGIDALITELRLARIAMERGHSYLPADPEWMRGDIKITTIEPKRYLTSDIPQPAAPKHSRSGATVLAVVLFVVLSLAAFGSFSVFHLLFG